MMTGNIAVRGLARICRNTSMPSTRGIFDVEQQQRRRGKRLSRVGALAEQKFEGLVPVLEALKAVDDARAFKVLLHQRRVTVVVLGEYDMEGLRRGHQDSWGVGLLVEDPIAFHSAEPPVDVADGSTTFKAGPSRARIPEARASDEIGRAT